MKNIKLTHFAVALMMALQWSCATHEPLIDAKDDSDVSNNSTQFDIIPGMSYVVNGKETAERGLIVTTQKNAWNVHFDFPENKVVISTTEKEFTKYVNSDEAFKARLEEGTISANNGQKEEFINSNTTSNSARVSAAPTLRLDYSNAVFFMVSYRPSDQTKTEFRTFLAGSDANIGDLTPHYLTTPSQAAKLTYSVVLTLPQGSTNRYVAIRNSQESGSVTKRFYANTSYGGTNVAYTIGANSTLKIPSTLRYRSYK